MSYSKTIKPIFDTVVAIALFLTLLPLLFILIFIQLIVFGKHLFFIQKRVGKHRQTFHIIKLTTLYPTHTKINDADRMPAWGSFLRRWHLDEIPQLLNIVKGEMSFVGPRPLLPEYLPYYSPKEQQRHQVKAGLTGLAQINGGQSLNWRRKMAWDIWYVKHQSFGLDMYILWRTFLKIIQSNSQEVHHSTGDLQDTPY